MKQTLKLILIGIAGGIVLAVFLKIIQQITANQAYCLLFETDYVPILQNWSDLIGMGMAFHFITCIASVVVLFYLLKGLHLERRCLPYVLVYTIGGAILFSLTALSENTPAITDVAAWGFWTLGHALFAITVGLLVKYW
ncbi:hypothetical protein P5G51_001240 [Virgibacillus sp. 179-BFC.A HS]|uniref:DUF423 domain-containing protein n=1 Tax=Tigheibacillus jepli TaxID=3035914 RepID=A0ABU5CF75_9BACI|nr:hypothetical protein [Virgibacillus sp. 179-BFC.A HS]MDY0404213.1 hypothetical protein [Virgibacillus sp. 179-BFC.A HS]